MGGGERPVTRELLDLVAGRVKVGLHSDTQVVFRRGSSRGTLGVVSQPQLVDQVCSATLCYGFADRIHRPPPEQLSNLKRAHQRYSLHPASQLEEVQLVLYERGAAGRYQQELNSLTAPE